MKTLQASVTTVMEAHEATSGGEGCTCGQWRALPGTREDVSQQHKTHVAQIITAAVHAWAMAPAPEQPLHDDTGYRPYPTRPPTPPQRSQR